MEPEDLQQLAIADLRRQLTPPQRAELRSDPKRWYDGLVMALQDVDSQLSHHAAELTVFQQECFAAGEDGKQRWFAAKAEHNEWRGRALTFRRIVIKQMRKVKARVEQERATSHDLRTAIRTHRDALLAADYEPSDADKALWLAADLEWDEAAWEATA